MFALPCAPSYFVLLFGNGLASSFRQYGAIKPYAGNPLQRVYLRCGLSFISRNKLMRHLFPSEGEGCNGDRFWVRPPRPSQRQQFRSDCSDPLQRPRPELGSSSAPELPEESGGASLLPLAPDHSARSLGPSALGLSPSLPSKRSNPLASSSEP